METQYMGTQSMESLKCEEVVVTATESIAIERYHFNIDMVKTDKILIKCNLDDILYSFHIIENDKWWQENKQLFQQDFNEFIKILTNALENRSSDFEVVITNKYINNLNVTITYQGTYFKFHILFKLVKEPSLEDKIEKLQSEMKELQLDNIELHKEIKKIREIREIEKEQDLNSLKTLD